MNDVATQAVPQSGTCPPGNVLAPLRLRQGSLEQAQAVRRVSRPCLGGCPLLRGTLRRLGGHPAIRFQCQVATVRIPHQDAAPDNGNLPGVLATLVVTGPAALTAGSVHAQATFTMSYQ